MIVVEVHCPLQVIQLLLALFVICFVCPRAYSDTFLILHEFNLKCHRKQCRCKLKRIKDCITIT